MAPAETQIQTRPRTAASPSSTSSAAAAAAADRSTHSLSPEQLRRNLHRLPWQRRPLCKPPTPTGESRYSLILKLKIDHALQILDGQTRELIALRRLDRQHFALTAPAHFSLSRSEPPAPGTWRANLDPTHLRIGHFKGETIVLRCRRTGAQIDIGQAGYSYNQGRMFFVAGQRFSISRVKDSRVTEDSQ